ncbi:MAG TPA: PilZ domain-containing protein [Candidatus Baltobacteraceae bacterium]|jgi:c-di-GMP-binding flagellar brake protein YcgR|nr:PilZ domain-containing protein [Candidatus Baltobacteraceae bacterium]
MTADSRTPKSSHHPEQRKYVRTSVSIEIAYGRDGQQEASYGLVIDLGGGGMRLATEEDLPLGTMLLLRFHIPESGKDVTARGRIVLSYYNAIERRYCHGIAFTNIAAADQEAIVRYVGEQLKRSQVHS